MDHWLLLKGEIFLQEFSALFFPRCSCDVSWAFTIRIPWESTTNSRWNCVDISSPNVSIKFVFVSLSLVSSEDKMSTKSGWTWKNCQHSFSFFVMIFDDIIVVGWIVVIVSLRRCDLITKRETWQSQIVTKFSHFHPFHQHWVPTAAESSSSSTH